MFALGRTAIRKGFLGGSTGWRILGLLIFVPKVLKLLFGRKAESITLGPLQAGEGVEIRAVRRS